MKNMNRLLIKYFNKDISSKEKQNLFNDIKNDKEESQDFKSLQNIYALMDWLPKDGDQEIAYKKLIEFKEFRKRKYLKSLYTRTISYAAILCLAIGIFWFITKNENITSFSNNNITTYQEIKTRSGQCTEIKLEDGTIVWLNVCSILKYPKNYNDKSREVILKGEAYFKVKHDTSRPFIVKTNNIQVKVTGTEFDIKAYANEHSEKVILAAGKVNVYNNNHKNNEPIVLRPNQMYNLINNNTESINMIDAKTAISWINGTYICNDETLQEFINQMERYYGVRIICQPNIAEYHCSGKFKLLQESIGTILDEIKEILPIQYKKGKDKYIISKLDKPKN